MEWRKTFCRTCQAQCAIEVETDGKNVLAVRGDRHDPVHGGFTCIKGRAIPEQHSDPTRLRHSLRRNGTEFEPIDNERALDEIAARLKSIIQRYGPGAVATYSGTYAGYSAGAWEVLDAFHTSLKSPSRFTCTTVDQPSRAFITPSRHGVWAAGPQAFVDADVGLFVAINPLVSMYGGLTGGFHLSNPTRRLNDAKARGYRFVCIDPRNTEMARRADIHLQVKPGEDAALLCGLIRVILEEGLEDAAFCRDHVDGVEALRAAVAPFTPDYVAKRCDVSADDVVAAARLFGGGRRGSATAGTGLSFGPDANIADHLVVTLNTICGRYARAGDHVRNPGIFRPTPRRAQAIPPLGMIGSGVTSRFREARQFTNGLVSPGPELPAPIAADEMLTEGEGQIRALISVGGNPLLAWPNQAKVRRALESLDLFVTLDPKMSASAMMSDYVIAPKLPLERHDATYMMEFVHPLPYAHYTQPVIEAPEGTIEEWAFIWGLAQRLDLDLELPGGLIPQDRRPTSRDIIKLLTPDALVDHDALLEADGGQVHAEFESVVLPAEEGHTGRLHVAPADVLGEIAEVLGRGEKSADFPYRLISRRLKHVANSFVQDLPMTRAKGQTNPAYVNPADLTMIGAEPGDTVEIESAIGRIPAIVAAADDLKPGTISLAHCWGELPESDHLIADIGVSVNRLIDDETDFQRYTGMALQSAIPVRMKLLRKMSQTLGPHNAAANLPS